MGLFQQRIGQPDETLQERRLARYIGVCLRRYALRWRHEYHSRSTRELMTLNMPISSEQGESTEVLELIAGGPAAEDDFLRRAPVEEVLGDLALYRAYQALTAHQRRVLRELVLGGERQQAVATRLNVSQQAVCRTKDSALRRLRSAL